MEEISSLKQNNTGLLNTIYKNAKIGLQNSNTLRERSTSNSLKHFLEKQNDDYSSIIKNCEQLAEKCDVTLNKIGWFTKMTMWTSVNVSSLTNDSTQHYAEMIIGGLNMGVVKMIKAIDEYNGAINDIRELAHEFKNLQEKYIDDTKKYLLVDPTSYSQNNKKMVNKNIGTEKVTKTTPQKTTKKTKKLDENTDENTDNIF